MVLLVFWGLTAANTRKIGHCCPPKLGNSRRVFQSPFVQQTVCFIRSLESSGVSASIQFLFELVKYVLGKDHTAGIQKRTERNPKNIYIYIRRYMLTPPMIHPNDGPS